MTQRLADWLVVLSAAPLVVGLVLVDGFAVEGIDMQNSTESPVRKKNKNSKKS